jgi:hypothetical protein
MNLRYWYLTIIALVVCLAGFLYVGKIGDYERSREIIAFREIGHKILLSVKDSTSRVLPVYKTSANHYKLEFERPFGVMPDSLVKVINKAMVANSVASDYVVNVLDARSNQLVYGYAFSKTSDNIVPCLGRELPRKKYTITIIPKAKSTSIVSQNKFPLFAFLLVIGLSGTAYFGRRKSTTYPNLAAVPLAGSARISIGEYSFYPGSLLLMHQDKPVVLTPKEAKLLSIFASDMNNVIDRNRLLKEGWEDEGVITQRSLDMYVSRLRKKLVNDPKIKITNVHGKGYCLAC